MDDEETKTCPNCKREIPAVNFTIHSVHCARNIKVCPVCKEPVPGPELDDHHQKMHKLLPCKQCGESVCGTDLEDHIRDSCADTVKSCRFCELDLKRRELPLHEGYCGARTEQCKDCGEWVMIKYRQLHLDSNHGFIRLDDDPAPNKKEPPKRNRPVDLNQMILNSNSPPKVVNVPSRFLMSPKHAKFDNTENKPGVSNIGSPRPGGSNVDSPKSEGSSLSSSMSGASSLDSPSSGCSSLGSPRSGGSNICNRAGASDVPKFENQRYTPSSSNEASNIQASFNRPGPSKPSKPRPDSRSSSTRPDSTGYSSSNSGLNPGPISASNGVARPNSISGLVTNNLNSTRPTFEIPGHSRVGNTEIQGSSNSGSGALTPSPNEASGGRAPTNGAKKRTNDQPQINMDTSATKTVDKDLRSPAARGHGAVKKRPAPAPPRPCPRRDKPFYAALQRHQRDEAQLREQNQYNLAHGLPPVLNPAQKLDKLRKLDALQNWELEDEWRVRRRPEPPASPAEPYGHVPGSPDDATLQEFMNLKPMSPTQFMRRFSSLQVSPPPAVRRASPPPAGDRFPEIRSSLRELRRGLNEVTAPYNSNNNNPVPNDNERVRPPSPLMPAPLAEDVQLPCEFCTMLVPADDLVQHQTGCRPDLAQYVAGAMPPTPAQSPAARGRRPAADAGDPLIPCEFCMESLPVYLITEHQERCLQGNDPV